MLSRVLIKSAFRGAASRVTRHEDVHLVRLRMQPAFEPQEEKVFTFCIDITIPKGCVCFVSSYPMHPHDPPLVVVPCFSIIGNGQPQALMLTMKNTSDMTVRWRFDDPIAVLKFIDAVPVQVVNTAS